MEEKMEKPKILNILVVDDEENICKMLTKWLSLEEHRVKSALTRQEALDLMSKDYFNFVFLDFVMPGISVIEILKEIKEISPKTKIVMMSGNLTDRNLLKELKQRGASNYLQKPFTINDIMEIIS
jgi:DNA-binding NtrC family response regulator